MGIPLPKDLIPGGIAGKQSGAASTNDSAMSDSDWAMVNGMKEEAGRLMEGQGLQSYDQLFRPQASQINTSAFNAAGSQAADLSRRGLSRSGMQTSAIQQTGQKRASALADASTSASKQRYDSTQDANSKGEDLLYQAADYQNQREALKLAQEQRADWEKSNQSTS